MRKVMFDEGRVVELNNQAKHAVTNAWSRHRVHLILDYVDVSDSGQVDGGVFWPHFATYVGPGMVDNVARVDDFVSGAGC